MKTTFLIATLSGCIALMILAGCLSLEKTFPEKQLYTLSPEIEIPSDTDYPEGALLSSEFSVAPVFRTNSFVLRKDPYRFIEDFRNEFIIPPNRMITDLTEELLLKSNRFVSYTAEASQLPLFRLSGRLDEIVGDYSDNTHLKAVLAVRFLVEKTEKAVVKIILSKTYRREILLKDEHPLTLLKGWNEGLSQILSAFYQDFSNQAK